MVSPLEIVNLFAYEGPNIFGPQPGVLLRVRCKDDYSQRIKDALKDGAQFIGMVLAYLDIAVVAEDTGVLISASFTTPTPTIGRDLAAYVVAGVRAQLTGDTDWDHETPLFALQQRRRQDSLSVSILQLIAEAHRRGLPVLHLPDGSIQFGYGARGWRFTPHALDRSSAADDPTEAHATVPPLTPPWESINTIPIYAVTGERNRSAVVAHVADHLRHQGYTISTLDGTSYDATLMLLGDPTTQVAVIGLETADILRRGVAFTTCTQSIVTDLQGEPPAEAATTTEWVRALGVPMLMSTSPAILNTADPTIVSLARYATRGVLPLHDLYT